MKKNKLKEYIRENIINELQKEQTHKSESPGVGDRVRIPFNLTTDPINKQGEEGVIKFIDERDVAYILFDDGLVGGYSLEVFDEELNEASEEEIEKQKELNKELEKTKELSSELSEDIEEPKSSEIKDDSITKLAKKLGEIKKEMKSLVKKYKDAKGEEKEELKSQLKKLTKIKKELESFI